MALLENKQNIFLEQQAQPYVKKGMDILNKYAELFNSARHFCQPRYQILENNYVQLPLNEVETMRLDYRPTFKEKQYEYFYNLTILFTIEYKQDVNNSATFNWIDGNKYYGSIDENFRNEFGNLYNGFSNPIFVKEDNCYKTNHSQTFKMQTTIEIKKELTKEEIYIVFDAINGH